jgi:hypothetical protein
LIPYQLEGKRIEYGISSKRDLFPSNEFRLYI